MSASVVDLNRTLPQNALTIAAPQAPRPTTRFDDVLANQQTRPKPAEAKPKDDAKPSGASTNPDKTEKSDKSEKTKSKAKAKPADDKKVDSADPHDDTDTDETEKADPAVAEAATPADGKPVAKSADAKKTKADGDVAGESDATDDHADASTAKTPALPTDTPAAEDKPVDPKAGTTKKPTKADKDTDETTKPDPAALAAQLNPQQPAPQPKADAKAQKQGDSDATTDSATAVTAGAKLATTAATPDETQATDEPADPKAKLAVQPKGARTSADAHDDADAQAAANAVLPDASKAVTKSADSDDDDAAAALQAVASSGSKPATTQHAALPAVPTAQQADAPRKSVAEDNVDRIVTSVRGELLTTGGKMQIRLDPPSLGAINIQINVDNGVISAQLQTTNDDATKLLSHNLSQLKNSLEAVGVTVDKIQVKQAAPTDTNNNPQSGSEGERRSSDGATQDQSARQEQQRREMLQRMWAKLSGSGDPLDLVA